MSGVMKAVTLPRFLVVALAIAVAILGSTTLFAAITSTTGAVVEKVPPPTSVLESDKTATATVDEIWIFPENSVVLPSNLTIDIKKTNPTLTIPASTPVKSYFIHYADGSAGLPNSGTATFDEPILGVIRTVSKINATDDLLGLPDTTYPTDPIFPDTTARGVELVFGDSISFPDNFTISVTLDTNRIRVDQLRVITQAPSDADGDGVSDADDPFPNSDLGPTVVVNGCDSGVTNGPPSNGATIADLVNEAFNAGGEDAVEDLLEGLEDDGTLSDDEAEAIEECAEEDDEDSDSDDSDDDSDSDSDD